MPLHQPQKQPTSASDNPNCHPSRVVTAHILNVITPSSSGNGQWEDKGRNVSTRTFFFPSRTMKVLTFPLQMWHRILTTKLLNDLILLFTQLYIPSQQHQEPTMQSLGTQRSFTGRSPQTDLLLLQSLKRRRNQLIPVNPSCPKTIQDWQATPWGGAQPSCGLSGPATSSGSPRAKAQSAAAPPRLQRLCRVWSRFRQKAAGVSEWNSLTNLYKESVYVYLVLRSGP